MPALRATPPILRRVGTPWPSLRDMVRCTEYSASRRQCKSAYSGVALVPRYITSVDASDVPEPLMKSQQRWEKTPSPSSPVSSCRHFPQHRGFGCRSWTTGTAGIRQQPTTRSHALQSTIPTTPQQLLGAWTSALCRSHTASYTSVAVSEAK